MTANDLLWKSYLSTDIPSLYKQFDQIFTSWDRKSFKYLLNLYINNKIINKHIEFILNEYNWEIYDKIFDYMISSTIDEELMNDLLVIISNIADIIKSKELYIISIDKMILIQQNNINNYYIFILLLFSLQRALIGLLDQSYAYVSSGLSKVLQTVEYLINNPESNDPTTISITNTTTINNYATNNYLEKNINTVLIFYDGLFNRSLSWCDRPDRINPDNYLTIQSNLHIKSQEYNNEPDLKLSYLLAGFLFDLSSKCVSKSNNISYRKQIMLSITYRVLVTFIPLDDILVHPFRLRYRIFRNKLLQIKQKESKSKRVNRLRSQINNQVDRELDISLFDSIPLYHRDNVIKYAKLCLGLVESNSQMKSIEDENGDIPSTNLLADSDNERDIDIKKLIRRQSRLFPAYNTSTTIKLSNNQSTGSNKGDWAGLLPWIDVNDNQLYSHSGSHLDNQVDRQLDSKIDTRTSDNNYFHNDLSWNLTGIAMVAESMLSNSLPNESTNHTTIESPKLLPQIYTSNYLWDRFSSLLHVLLYDNKLASNEGLYMLLSIVKSMNIESNVDYSIEMKYLPELVYNDEISVDSLYQSLDNNKFNYTGSNTSQSKVDDIAIVGLATSNSQNTLLLFQTILSAISQCADSSLRTNSFQAFKTLLLLVEDRSRLLLLNRLVDECPYPPMRGLLVDCIKDSTIKASNKDQTNYSSTSSNQLTTLSKENQQDNYLYNWPGSSPFWSDRLVDIYINKLISYLDDQSISEIENNSDLMLAIVTLLQFIINKLKYHKNQSNYLYYDFFGYRQLENTVLDKEKDLITSLSNRLTTRCNRLSSQLTSSQSISLLLYKTQYLLTSIHDYYNN